MYVQKVELSLYWLVGEYRPTGAKTGSAEVSTTELKVGQPIAKYFRIIWKVIFPNLLEFKGTCFE